MHQLFPYRLKARKGKQVIQVTCPSCYSRYTFGECGSSMEGCGHLYSRFGNIVCCFDSWFMTSESFRKEIEMLLQKAPDLFQEVEAFRMDRCPYCSSPLLPTDRSTVEDEIFFVLQY